jgi:ubiquinone/menaquinone biosynthesis C-methylase UbiE
MNERVFNGTFDKLRQPERLERLEVGRVINILTANRNIKTVLDIGTGTGVFAEEFYKNSFEVSAIDLNPNMIEEAKKYAPQVTYKVAPAENIPFADKSFDLVFMGLVFHEVDSYEKTLSEAKRVSKQLIGILEWSYVLEEVGPPLEHRIKPEIIKELYEKLNFHSFERINLNTLVLYILEV